MSNVILPRITAANNNEEILYKINKRNKKVATALPAEKIVTRDRNHSGNICEPLERLPARTLFAVNYVEKLDSFPDITNARSNQDEESKREHQNLRSSNYYLFNELIGGSHNSEEIKLNPFHSTLKIESISSSKKSANTKANKKVLIDVPLHSAENIEKILVSQNEFENQKERFSGNLQEFENKDRLAKNLQELLRCRKAIIHIDIIKPEHKLGLTATPVFHCLRCFESWKKSIHISYNCREICEPTRGEPILLDDSVNLDLFNRKKNSVRYDNSNKIYKYATEKLKEHKKLPVLAYCNANVVDNEKKAQHNTDSEDNGTLVDSSLHSFSNTRKYGGSNKSEADSLVEISDGALSKIGNNIGEINDKRNKLVQTNVKNKSTDQKRNTEIIYQESDMTNEEHIDKQFGEIPEQNINSRKLPKTTAICQDGKESKIKGKDTASIDESNHSKDEGAKHQNNIGEQQYQANIAARNAMKNKNTILEETIYLMKKKKFKKSFNQALQLRSDIKESEKMNKINNTFDQVNNIPFSSKNDSKLASDAISTTAKRRISQSGKNLGVQKNQKTKKSKKAVERNVMSTTVGGEIQHVARDTSLINKSRTSSLVDSSSDVIRGDVQLGRHKSKQSSHTEKIKKIAGMSADRLVMGSVQSVNNYGDISDDKSNVIELNNESHDDNISLSSKKDIADAGGFKSKLRLNKDQNTSGDCRTTKNEYELPPIEFRKSEKSRHSFDLLAHNNFDSRPLSTDITTKSQHIIPLMSYQNSQRINKISNSLGTSSEPNKESLFPLENILSKSDDDINKELSTSRVIPHKGFSSSSSEISNDILMNELAYLNMRRLTNTFKFSFYNLPEQYESLSKKINSNKKIKKN